MIFVIVPINCDSVKAVLRLWQIITIYIMSSRGELVEGGPSDWWLNEGTKLPHRKKISMLQNVTQDL